jgi:hypothetical protein
MTQAAPTPPPDVLRLRVCSFCEQELATHSGAQTVPGPHTIEMDTPCETHGPVGVLMASRVIDLPRKAFDARMAAFEAKPLAPAESAEDLYDAHHVAQLAATLIASPRFEFKMDDDAITVAVPYARKLIAAARGK